MFGRPGAHPLVHPKFSGALSVPQPEPQVGSYACIWIPRVDWNVRLFGRKFTLRNVPNLAGWAIRLFTWSSYCHSILYIGDGKAIEARPSGAGIVDLAEYAGMPCVWSEDGLTPEEQARVVARARSTIGTPYGWLDLVAIGLARLGFPYGWVLRRVLSEATMICSQDVAMSGNAARWGMWMCGEPYAQLVTPGLLARRVTRQ